VTQRWWGKQWGGKTISPCEKKEKKKEKNQSLINIVGETAVRREKGGRAEFRGGKEWKI